MNRTINLQEHITELVTEGRALSFQLEDHFNSRLVHKLRVCVRRLRTMIDILNKDSVLAESDRGHLKSLWKKLGKVRDLDVAHELSEKFGISVDKIKAKRSLARKKLRTKLQDKKTQKLFDDLEKLGLQALTSRVDPLPHLHLLRMRLIRTPGDAEHLHDLRIVMKKIRYFAEALELDVEAFKEFQDTLGEFHDLEVFHRKHPHSLAVRRLLNIKRLKALGMGRSAVQLGLKVLGEIEHQYEREMAVKAS